MKCYGGKISGGSSSRSSGRYSGGRSCSRSVEDDDAVRGRRRCVRHCVRRGLDDDAIADGRRGDVRERKEGRDAAFTARVRKEFGGASALKTGAGHGVYGAVALSAANRRLPPI